MTIPRLPLLLLAMLLAMPPGPAALAQDKVWRCGPDGREYSPTPCPGGREVTVADPRDASQKREAQDVAARESRLGNKLRAERRSAEKAAARQGAAGIEHDRSDKLAKAETTKKKRTRKGHALAKHGATKDPGDAPFTARDKP